INDNFRVQIGGAAYHLTEPKEAFYTRDENFLKRRYLGHASATIGFQNKFFIFPFAQYQTQADNALHEIIGGANLGYKLGDVSDETATMIYAGVFDRYNVNLVPTFGFMIRSFQVGFSYDVGISSDLQPLDNGKGGFEVSLSYFGGNPEHS